MTTVDVIYLFVGEGWGAEVRVRCSREKLDANVSHGQQNEPRVA
jgi:hypothetical protein